MDKKTEDKLKTMGLRKVQLVKRVNGDWVPWEGQVIWMPPETSMGSLNTMCQAQYGFDIVD